MGGLGRTATYFDHQPGGWFLGDYPGKLIPQTYSNLELSDPLFHDIILKELKTILQSVENEF